MRNKSLTVAEMRAHIDDLVEKNDITRHRVDRPMRAFSAWECWEIHIPEIRSAISYATALHEIGHLKGRYRASKLLMVRERDAWRWAKTNAIYWTDRIDKHAADCLAWYERQIADGKMSSKCEPAIYGAEFLPENGR